MELVGRDAELAAAAAAVDAVRGGGVRFLGLFGEAGIGKTGLLAAIGARASEAGLLVVEGRGAEHEREVPFGLVIDALDGRVALPSDVNERFRYHRALRERIESLAPVALLLDDLHWADEASVELVLHLLHRPPRAACLVAFASRPGDRTDRVLAAARATPGWLHMPLAPLSHAASLALLGEGVPQRERIAREAAGNPLFLRELARSGEATLPPTLAATVALDMAALEPPERALLHGAAVAGDPFDPELAAAAAGLEPRARTLDRLAAAGLVAATGDGCLFAFRHPLVRRAVYESAPPAWRLEAHERAAVALEHRGARPAARAYHVERSARPGDAAAVTVLASAAESAAATSPASAAHWYGAALRVLPDDAAQRAGLLASQALTLANAGRLEESRTALLEVLAREPGRLDLVAACAQVESALGRHAEARRRLVAALEGAPPAGQAALAFELATDAMTHGRSEDLRRWAELTARAAEDPVLRAGGRTLGALGAIWTGSPADADPPLDGFDDAALAARLGVVLQVSRAQLRLGRFTEARATATRALAVFQRTPQEEIHVWLRALRAWTRVLLLDLDGALADVEAAEESARLQDVPHLLMLAACKRILAHHHRGEAAEAEQAAAGCLEIVAALEPSAFTAHVRCQAAEAFAERDPERAIREIQTAAGAQLEATDPSMSSWTRVVLVRAAIAAGREEDAARWAEDGPQLRLPIVELRANRARAEVLLVRAEPVRAAELALAAAAAAERLPAPLDAAEANLLAGRALAAAGEPERAKATLQLLAADAGRGGALRLRDAAARDLRRLGTRVSAESRRAVGREPLSDRERHIAELVARGQTNKQVATALFLSEKTVRNALTRVYAKLGVRSRAQIAGALAR